MRGHDSNSSCHDDEGNGDDGGGGASMCRDTHGSRHHHEKCEEHHHEKCEEHHHEKCEEHHHEKCEDYHHEKREDCQNHFVRRVQHRRSDKQSFESGCDIFCFLYYRAMYSFFLHKSIN